MAITQIPNTVPQINQSGPQYLDNLTNRYLIQPKSVQGIGGFLFDYEGEEGATLHADITDHFTENNSAIQDHIARSPIKLSLRGFVAELVLNANAPFSSLSFLNGIASSVIANSPNFTANQQNAITGAANLGFVNSIQNRLTTVPAYLGKYTPSQIASIQKTITKTQSTINTINQSVARVQNVVGLFTNAAPGLTAIERAFNKLAALWETNQLMLVQTPYGTFGNMAIEDLNFTQDDTTKGWADITVKLKGIRFAAVQTSTIDFKSGRLVSQAQDPSNQGSTSGIPKKTPLLKIAQYISGDNS